MKIRKLKLAESNKGSFFSFGELKIMKVVSHVCVNLVKKMSLKRERICSNLKSDLLDLVRENLIVVI